MRRWRSPDEGRLRNRVSEYAWRAAARVALAGVCLAILIGLGPSSYGHSTWKDYGGGLDNSHFSTLTQVNKSNVHLLRVAWTYHTGDDPFNAFNPIVVHGAMYVLGKNNSLVALNAETGQEIWVHENLTGIQRRGVAYWESKDGADRRLIFQMHDQLQELDARTGKSILAFGKSGYVDLRQGLRRDPQDVYRIQPNTPGRVFENLVIIGSYPGENYLAAPGDIRAFDIPTGKLVWTFHTIPYPGEFGYDTWPKDAWKYAGGANLWGEVGSSRVDLQACKLEYSIVSPK